MATIQCVKGRWYGRYVDLDTGKRVSIPLGRDRDSAKAWKLSTTALEGAGRRVLRASLGACGEADSGPRLVAKLSLGDAHKAFLAFLGGRVQAVTFARYQGHVRAIERTISATMPVSQFGPKDVDAFVQARLTEGIDPRSIAKEQAFLRRLVRFVHERWPKEVPQDWSHGTALKPLPDGAGKAENREHRADRPVLSPERLRRLLEALPQSSRLGQRVRFLLYCPVRPVEMLRLKVQDVDLEAGVLTIRIRKNGRTGGERKVSYPMAASLLHILQAAVQGKHLNDVVFPRPSDGLPQTTSGLCQEWDAWRSKTPEFQDVKLYALRRTVATAADRTAKNAILAMGALNHKTWQAHRHYSDLDLEDARGTLVDALKSLGL